MLRDASENPSYSCSYSVCYLFWSRGERSLTAPKVYMRSSRSLCSCKEAFTHRESCLLQPKLRKRSMVTYRALHAGNVTFYAIPCSTKMVSQRNRSGEPPWYCSATCWALLRTACIFCSISRFGRFFCDVVLSLPLLPPCP